MSLIEQKLLKFEERKERLELKAIRDQQKEDQLVHSLLMERRQQQIEQLKENQEFMDEWMKKGKKDWGKNKRVTLERIQKEQILEKALTDKYINKIKKNMTDATDDVVGGIDSFEKNLARIGIENEANLEALDDSKKPPTGSKKPLGGFSFPATMMKIKEQKLKGDEARKERDRRQRKLKVVQAQTQESVKLKTREEELLAKFTSKTLEETNDSYLLFRKSKCKALEAENLKRKNVEMTNKKQMELEKLKRDEENDRSTVIKEYKQSCQQKLKETKQRRLENWMKKKEINTFFCNEIMKAVLDVVEEIHVSNKGKHINKPQWRDLMNKFKNNEQIYTHQHIQIQQEEDDEDEGEEIDFDEINEDYLAAVGKWNPMSLVVNNKKSMMAAFVENQIEIPDFDGFVNNNRVLGLAVKEITRMG